MPVSVVVPMARCQAVDLCRKGRKAERKIWSKYPYGSLWFAPALRMVLSCCVVPVLLGEAPAMEHRDT